MSGLDLDGPPTNVREVLTQDGACWWLYTAPTLGPSWTNGQRSLKWADLIGVVGPVMRHPRAQHDHIEIYALDGVWDIVQYPGGGWGVHSPDRYEPDESKVQKYATDDAAIQAAFDAAGA
jgi:hypothetical protein